MKVLITGGTGSLGRELVRAAQGGGHTVRVLSRRPRAQSTLPEIEWAQGDIVSGEGLQAAVNGVGAIIHAASDPRRAEAVDVGGTRQMVEASRAAGVAHIVYISIVGIDDIPYSYYQRKLAAEEIIKSSGVPYSIMRATQFHSFVDVLLSKASRIPFVVPLPIDFKFQSVDESEVAEQLTLCLEDGPRGRVADFGGPQTLSLGEMAEAWMEVKGFRKKLLNLPLPGKIAAAFRRGKNTTSEEEVRGIISWREWLAGRSEQGVA
jgi:uncharacterized protein YbjT (DUF2867 family)